MKQIDLLILWVFQHYHNEFFYYIYLWQIIHFVIFFQIHTWIMKRQAHLYLDFWAVDLLLKHFWNIIFYNFIAFLKKIILFLPSLCILCSATLRNFLYIWFWFFACYLTWQTSLLKVIGRGLCFLSCILLSFLMFGNLVNIIFNCSFLTYLFSLWDAYCGNGSCLMLSPNPYKHPSFISSPLNR
jgi:hypothetical protein